MRVSFLGDISLNDGYTNLYKVGADPFKKIVPRLQKSDLVIGNLECTAEGKNGQNLLKKPRLKTTLGTLNFLSNLKLDIVTLAHNHIYDNLEDGFNNTTNFLIKNNINFLGSSLTKSLANNVLEYNLEGKSLAFFNYVTQDTNPSLPDNAKVYPNIFSIEKAVNDLQHYENADFRILLLHWGGKYEGNEYPGTEQPSIAKTLFDNGADLIIGHHSHTFQPFEKIKGKYVFYSIGNFCFSDIYYDNKVRKMNAARYRRSAIVHVDIINDELKVSIEGIINKNLRICPSLLSKIIIYKRNCMFMIFKHIKIIWRLNLKYHLKLRPIIEGIFRIDKNRSIISRIRSFKFTKISGMKNA
jgi:hypothetical protein